MTHEDIKNKVKPVFKKYGIIKAGLFGSTAKGLAKKNSDVDILVEIGMKGLSLFDFVGIKLELEDALQKRVDLVEYSTIKPALRNKILSEEVSIL